MLPPVPFPRTSPATRMRVVPDRTDGFQVKPVPRLETAEIAEDGTEKDWPPGMMPSNVGLLNPKMSMLNETKTWK